MNSLGQSNFAPVPNRVTFFSIITSISSSNLNTLLLTSILLIISHIYSYILIYIKIDISFGCNNVGGYVHITEKEVIDKVNQLESIIEQYKQENPYEDTRDWKTYEEKLAHRIRIAIRSLEPMIDEAIATLHIVEDDEKRGKPQSLTLKQKVTLLLIKQLIGKSNREMSGMLVLFSLLNDVDVSYKTVERLYNDEEVYLVLCNLVQLTLRKKDVKEVDGSGDGTGYSLSIRRHYATEASKRNEEVKENKEDYKKSFAYSFTLLDLDTKMYVGYGSSMRSEREAYNKARDMMKRLGVKMRTIRLDRYYSGQSTLEQFNGTTFYFIPKKNTTLRGGYEWNRRLFDFVNNTFDYLRDYFGRENSEAEFSADKRRFGWTVRQRIDNRIDTALLAIVVWHNMYHIG